MDELKSFKIREDLTIFDLLKVNRLFTFLAHVTRKILKTALDDEPRLAYRSLVPVFDDEKFNTILGWCLPQEKIETMLGVLSWTPGTAEVIDLQYRPILRVAGHYLSPLNLAGTMNWYRNLDLYSKEAGDPVGRRRRRPRGISPKRCAVCAGTWRKHSRPRLMERKWKSM